MTNWITIEVLGRMTPTDEITRQRIKQEATSHILGIVLYELGCLTEDEELPIRRELGVGNDVARKWLKLYVDEEMDGSAEAFWQTPSDAASKLKALANLFHHRTEAAQWLWRRATLEGIFDNLVPRALAMDVDTDRPSPGCSSGDWACHLAYCLRATAEVLEGLERKGETGVLLSFAPFY